MSAQVTLSANVSHTKLDSPNSGAGSDIEYSLCSVSIGREISLAAECQEKLMVLEICCFVTSDFQEHARRVYLSALIHSGSMLVNICIGMDRRLYLITGEPVFCECQLA